MRTFLSKRKKIVAFILLILMTGISGYLILPKKIPVTPPITPPVKKVDVNPGKPTHEVLGYSVEGRTIDAYTYGTGTSPVLFVGGMHGGYEWNSVLLAYEFMDYIEAHPNIIPKKYSITVIPDINPDGVFAIIHKEGRFTLADTPASSVDVSQGRFNAHKVDLNRNFACNWKATSTWRKHVVSAGTAAFSEPESKALKSFVDAKHPVAAVFWHSQANAVYASECNKGILPRTLDIMNTYAHAAGYPAVKSFDSYAITGDSEGWLASIGVPAITVELKTHDTVEWEKNLLGINALLDYFRE